MSAVVRDDDSLTGLRALARILDEAITIPGTRFKIGLDAIIGLIPWAGDVTGGVLTGATIFTAYRMGAPPTVLLNMVLNLGIDALIGAIPVLGDIFDFAFKANKRNLALLDSHVQNPKAARKSSLLALFAALGVLALLIIGMIWVSFSVLQLIAAAL
jgi:hypothetical protein